MSKDLVGDGIAEVEQRREDAWATLKDMHDQVNGTGEPKLTAAQGWCSPSTCGTTSFQIKNAAGQVVVSWP